MTDSHNKRIDKPNALYSNNSKIMVENCRNENVEKNLKDCPQYVNRKNLSKSDWENGKLRHEKISLVVGKLIMEGRQAKCLSQKDLATKIYEKQQIIAEYEGGRAIVNNAILAKMEKVIGIKLSGKNIGQPIVFPMKKVNKRK